MAPRKLLGQALKELGFIHEGMVQEALTIQKTLASEEGREKRIGEILVDLGYVDQEQLGQGLAQQVGLTFIPEAELQPDPSLLGKIDSASARVYNCLPIRMEGDQLLVAVGDPLNLSMLQDLAFQAGCELTGALADPQALAKAIESAYGAMDQGVGSMGALGDAVKEFTESGTSAFDLDDKEAMATAAPVVKLLNFILYQAVRDKASDIHLEPFEDDFKIRYRVDGVLYELKAPPPHLAIALISRVKVMAELDIAETRIPQDGRIELAVGSHPVDLRVSTLPTMFGESCVMRILDRSVVSLDLESIGLRKEELKVFERVLGIPHGIVLVTGPTGSGKTTTLYAALNSANEEGVKLITVEDPVEYDLEGIIQVPVNEDIGVTYSAVLRTILRQDPDKILVGEIRDGDTARTAIEASLTGHVVFSTLHTNDAPSAITRLLDLGVEPYLLTSTVEVIIAQRLVRRICTDCRQSYEPESKVLQELGLSEEEVVGKHFSYGKGCDHCNFTGYRGRTAIFEIMEVSEAIKMAILEEAPTGRLREQARKEGMRSLRDSGLLAIFDGQTTVEEVLRETM